MSKGKNNCKYRIPVCVDGEFISKDIAEFDLRVTTDSLKISPIVFKKGIRATVDKDGKKNIPCRIDEYDKGSLFITIPKIKKKVKTEIYLWFPYKVKECK